MYYIFLVDQMYAKSNCQAIVLWRLDVRCLKF